MAKAIIAPTWQHALVLLTGTVVGVVVIACLYFAQTVFIPVALAIFLTFLLAPLVTALQRRGLGRTLSVILVVLMAALALGGTLWLVTSEVTSLVGELPEYTENIKGKIKSLREMSQGPATERLEKMIQDITRELQSQPPNAEPGPKEPPPGAARETPAPVVVQPDSPAWLSARLPALLGSVVESLGGLALALVLVIFMLLKRESLRNRLIRLIGHGSITRTTKAVEDAGRRVSRFLLMQFLVNSTYGLAVTLGLLAIGVEHPLLWGFLAAVLRYIPYIGVWIAIMPPILLSLAMFEGWVRPGLVIGLFIVIELLSNNIIEPRLYGKSMGVSEVALLVIAAFWAFLWGPIGLILSSPLTVCLVVLGKYVPHLEFFDVLLGDEPALDAQVSYYQRLLARDQDEATQLVLGQVKISSLDHVYDGLLVPAMNHVKRDREQANLTEDDEKFVLQATREIVEDLGERQTVAAEEADNLAKQETNLRTTSKVRILGCPGHDEADALALEMLRQLLDPGQWEMEVLSIELLSAELIARAGDKDPVVVCVGALPPGGLAHTRYLCKRLRARLPRAKIVVGRWGLQENLEQNQERLLEAGADQVETTLLETRDHLNSWLPVFTPEASKAAANSTPLCRQDAAV